MSTLRVESKEKVTQGLSQPMNLSGKEKKKEQDSFSKILLDEKSKRSENKSPDNEKGASKEKDDNTQAILAKKTQDLQQELTPLHRFLYDLVYRDPSTWSTADKAHYHVEKGQVSLREFYKMMEDRKLKIHELSEAQIGRIARMDTRRQLTLFLDGISRDSLLGQQQASARRFDRPFGDLKTSLQEIQQTQRIKESEIIEQVVRQISLRRVGKSSEVNIILNPEALGEVRLQILVKENQVTAKFKATSHAVREILSTHLDELNQALVKQGLDVKGLEVEKIHGKGISYV